MKKATYLIYFLFIIYTLKAQKNDQLGVIAGLNYTTINLHNETKGRQIGKIGFQVGGLYKTWLSDHFRLRSEFIFSRQRAQFIRDTYTTPYKSSIPLGIMSGSIFYDLTDVDVTISELIAQIPIMIQH